jgi:hypothetical protein
MQQHISKHVNVAIFVISTSVHVPNARRSCKPVENARMLARENMVLIVGKDVDIKEIL